MTSSTDIFVSTGAFQTRDINTILDLCLQHNIVRLELSSFCNTVSNAQLRRIEKLAKAKRLTFLVHNYFPVPSQPFVLNLASNNPETTALCVAHCKRAIDLSAAFGAPFFSVHSGFCVHATPDSLGSPLAELPRIPMREAEAILIENLRLLAEYAACKNIILAVENHVLSPYNLINGKNELLLGVTALDLLNIVQATACKNVKVLLDLAHLKVSAVALNIDPVQEVRLLNEKTVAFHLSDNNGQNDTNDPVSQSSWFWPILSKSLAERPVPVVIEVNNLPVPQIIEQLHLITQKTTGETPTGHH